MADTVQYLMEEMIPELEDLETKGYFSKSEIKQIVKKRQDFEYLLKRRATLKQDFMRYVEYETKLEDLRRRRKRMHKIKGKKSIADHAIVRRIHFIYERAARKFKSDLNIWMDWIRFCKQSKSTKQLSKVITKALHRHATVPALWIEAAAWEFESNGDVGAARALMQQGLRMCKHEQAMWVEYLRMELLYVHKLRLRRQVLGIDVPDQPVTETQADDSEAAVNAVLSGAVARIAYRSAIAAIPKDIGFRKKLLVVLEAFDFAGVDGLRDMMYVDVEKDFAGCEEAWDMKARRNLPAGTSDFNLTAYTTAREIYSSALSSLPTPKMHDFLIAFISENLDLTFPNPARVSETAALAADLLTAAQHAHDAGLASEGLYLSWINWSMKVNQPKIAVKAARKACEKLPSSVAVWSARLGLELQFSKKKEKSGVELFSTLEAALEAVGKEGASEIWAYAFAAVKPGEEGFERLWGMCEKQLAGSGRGPVCGGVGEVLGRVVEEACEKMGVEAARKLYTRMLQVPAPGGDFFKAALRIEQTQLTSLLDSTTTSTATTASSTKSQQADALSRIRRLFEVAIDVYGSEDAELWLAYAAFEQKQMKGAGDLYWRATKALIDPEPFVVQYRAMLGL